MQRIHTNGPSYQRTITTHNTDKEKVTASTSTPQPVVVVEPPTMVSKALDTDARHAQQGRGEDRADGREGALSYSPTKAEYGNGLGNGAPPSQHAQHIAPLAVPTNGGGDASYPASVRTNRSRSSSIFVMDDVDEADSEVDSVLSFWSDDEADDSDADPDPTTNPGTEAKRKDEERARREAEREKQLAKAGLKIRREPPGVPQRRKQAPAVPSRAHKPSALHANDTGSNTPTGEQAEEPIEVEDAYARYEAFLAEAKSKPAPRPNTAPKVHTEVSLPTPTAPAPSATQRFSGFISRITGSVHQPAKPAPVISRPVSSAPISGPISAPKPASPEGEAEESGFGQTWSSLVDASVLETMPPQERKRQEALFELIATEASYVADVQLLVGVWYARLIDVLDEQSLGVIFANIEDIMMFNSRLLSLLEERQKQCRLYIDSIADILVENLKDLDVYIPYCLNQENARQLLVQLRRQRPELDVKLVEIRNGEPAVRGLDISSFLLEPMQRVTRYPLLLRQVLNYTQPDQDHAQLEVALNTAQDMVTRVNERVREAEATDRLRTLSEQLWVGGEGRIDLTAPTAYPGPRKLLKEGPVAKAKSGRRLQMVLCNDIVILIEDERLYRMPMSLFDLSIATGPETIFALIPGSPKNTVRLKAPSTSAKAEWVHLLNTARKDAIAARRASVMSFDSGRDSGRSAFDAPRPHRERSGSYASSLSMGDRTAPSFTERAPGISNRRASGGPDKRLSVMSISSQRSARSSGLTASPGQAYSLPPGAAPPMHPHSPPLPPRHVRQASTSSNFSGFLPPGAATPTTGHPGNIPAGYSDAELERYARQYDDMLGPARDQVYDDAHSYAGQGRSMYEHEF